MAKKGNLSKRGRIYYSEQKINLPPFSLGDRKQSFSQTRHCANHIDLNSTF